MNHWLKDFKAAAYSLSRRPGFMTVVILTLTLTLGAFITMATLTYTLLIKPLPYADQDRLFVAQGERYMKNELLGVGVHSYGGVAEAYKKNPVFAQSAILNYERQTIASISGQPSLNTTHTTPEFFSILGAKMVLGRNFDPQTEGMDSRKAVAIISYKTWHRNYGGQADVLNKKIQIGDVSFNIIGVVDQNFVEPAVYQPGRKTSIWLPIDYNYRDETERKDLVNGSSSLKLIGLLKEGTTVLAANQYFSTTMNDSWTEAVRSQPWGKDSRLGVSLRTFEDIIVGNSRATTLMLLAGVFALLMIACANIANLFLARAAEKQRQYAIQATLGAQKFHIFRVIFIELFILTASSTILAILFSHGVLGIIRQAAQGQLARLDELMIGPVIIVFSIAVAIILALGFAAIISNLIDYKALNSILRSSGKGSGLQISKRTRNILVISQVALAAVLLTGNLTLLKGSLDIINQDPGFNTEGIVWVSLDTGAQTFGRDERVAFIDSISAKLKQLPQVKSVSNSVYPPTTINNWTSILNEDLSGKGARALPNMNLIDENYMSMFNLPLVEGRYITATEIKDSAKVMILNETVAAVFAAGGSALGKNVYWEDKKDPYKVVGIIKDINIPRFDSVPQMFAGRSTGLGFMIQLKPNQQLGYNQLSGMFSEINQNLSIGSYDRIEELYMGLLNRDFAISAITILLSALTLFLASLGIYGVLSYSINLRTYELGVRMALGGSPKAITTLVFKDSGKPVVWGFAVSVVVLGGLYALLTQKMGADVPIEISALLMAFVFISLTSALACYLPLKKIVKFQPIKALR